MVHAVTNSAGLKGDDDQTRRVLDDLRGLVLSLEISKTSLKSMINMNEQLVAVFTRQMMLAERRDQLSWSTARRSRMRAGLYAWTLCMVLRETSGCVCVYERLRVDFKVGQSSLMMIA